MNKSVLLTIGVVFISLVLITVHVAQPSNGLTLLTVTHNKTALVQKPDGKLTRGKKVYWVFTSEYNNLGTVLIHFDSQNRFINDRILFKLKEEGSGQPIYENIYSARDMKDLELFPFGFPLIQNSRNKTYEVELASLHGTTNEAIQLHTQQPIFQSRYQYSKRIILSNLSTLTEFIVAKIQNCFSDYNLLFVLLIFSILFVSALVTLNRSTVFLLLSSLSVLILYYAFAIQPSYFVITCACVMIMWILSMRSSYSRSYLISFPLYLLALCLFFASFGNNEAAVKLGNLWLLVNLSTLFRLILILFHYKYI